MAAAAISSSTSWAKRRELEELGVAPCAGSPGRERPVPDGCTVGWDQPSGAAEPVVGPEVRCALVTDSPCTD